MTTVERISSKNEEKQQKYFEKSLEDNWGPLRSRLTMSPRHKKKKKMSGRKLLGSNVSSENLQEKRGNEISRKWR